MRACSRGGLTAPRASLGRNGRSETDASLLARWPDINARESAPVSRSASVQVPPVPVRDLEPRPAPLGRAVAEPAPAVVARQPVDVGERLLLVVLPPDDGSVHADVGVPLLVLHRRQRDMRVLLDPSQPRAS